MPCWYFEKKEIRNSPSFVKDGMDPAVEAENRTTGARFIMKCGDEMKLSKYTSATGVVYLHRFYMKHSFVAYPKIYSTAAACLFLAGKVEENPKKMQDILKVVQGNLPEKDNAKIFAQNFGHYPQDELMTMEKIVLHTIKFDLQVEHPYTYMLQYAKKMQAFNDSDKERFNDKVQILVQTAWTLVNDSLCTTLCLQWEPDLIAIALMYLATRVRKIEITNWEGKPDNYEGLWYTFFVADASKNILEDICHQVLDLYQTGSSSKKSDQKKPQASSTPSHRSNSASKRSHSGSSGDSASSKLSKVSDNSSRTNKSMKPRGPETSTPHSQATSSPQVSIGAASSIMISPSIFNTATPPPPNLPPIPPARAPAPPVPAPMTAGMITSSGTPPMLDLSRPPPPPQPQIPLMYQPTTSTNPPPPPLPPGQPLPSLMHQGLNMLPNHQMRIPTSYQFPASLPNDTQPLNNHNQFTANYTRIMPPHRDYRGFPNPASNMNIRPPGQESNTSLMNLNLPPPVGRNFNMRPNDGRNFGENGSNRRYPPFNNEKGRSFNSQRPR